ncbi:MAG: LamG domain-containing protein [Pseudomonadota bacterium]
MTITFKPLGAQTKALLLTALSAAVLAGCGSGSGADVVANNNPANNQGGNQGVAYNGPAPQTADVQNFKNEVWDNIILEATCGNCHIEGQQAPTFARGDDINMAYADSNPLVDLLSPQNSRLVTKVGSGHNCWLSSDQACADIMQTWIENWAGGNAAAGGRDIVLEAPTAMTPGSSKNFPADSATFQATVYPLLEQYCQECHSSGSQVQQSPFMAEPPDDMGSVAVAYDAVKTKINLDAPELSRLVIRLSEEFHNCWSDCQSDAAQMLSAINAFANPIQPDQVNPALVFSDALTIFDGTIASGGNRHETDQIALYEFKEGSGTTAFDTSGVTPALDLTLSGDVVWVGGWGIQINNGKAQGSTADSAKLHQLITATGEYSVEAWVAPANVVQENARIVSYSAGPFSRNFTLGQTMYDYDFFNRSENTDGNGDPALSTPSAEEVLQATLQHVVATYDPVNGRRIYVNGELRAGADEANAGSIADWDNTFAFVVGNEVSSDGLFQGVLRMVAVHNRALTESQIRQNLEVGVGEKFFLLFGISHLVDVPQAYIVIEVSQFDSYAYLFNKPFFISLQDNITVGNIPLQGMRIGINGSEAKVGQAWANLSTTLTDATYNPASGQSLSTVGTTIGLQKGPDADEFFLTFDQLGNNSFVRTIDPPVVVAASDGVPTADIGVRTFDEIAATMSVVTGTDPQDANILATYQGVRESLPAVDGLNAFLSSHQVVIASLAITYCDALVEDTGLRATYFAGFNFGASPAVAFSGGGRDIVIDSLVGNAVGNGIGTQPDYVTLSNELGYATDNGNRPNNLIDRLINGGNADTPGIVKGVCAAVVGSAATLVQ